METGRPRGEHPTDTSWRADALARSDHTRWIDELRAPLENHDPERAAEICAAVARASLRDLAPAVVLLDPYERRRAQALAAYALTLFDFARQTGLEGERLAQINRVEFELDAALDGQPRGQPVFILMAEAAAVRSWPRDELDRVAAAARLRVTLPRPVDSDQAAHQAEQLGSAILACLGFGGSSALAAGLLRLSDLMGLGDDVRRHRPRLPMDEMRDDWISGTSPGPELDQLVRRECERIRPLLESRPESIESPTARRAERYLRLAARRLLGSAARLGSDLLAGPPQIGAATRLGFLGRARLGL